MSDGSAAATVAWPIHVEPHRYEPFSRWERFRTWTSRRCKACLAAEWNHAPGSHLWFPARALVDKQPPLPFERLSEASRVRPVKQGGTDV